MKFNKKSGITAILSTAMIVSSVPATVFASENESSAVSVEQTNDAEEGAASEKEMTETEGAASEKEMTETEGAASEKEKTDVE